MCYKFAKVKLERISSLNIIHYFRRKKNELPLPWHEAGNIMGNRKQRKIKMDVCENVLAKGNLINVKIEELLPDIILVSFNHLTQLFHGVLLDSTKRSFPCGIYPPKDAFHQQEHKNAIQDSADEFYSVKQRYSYFEKQSENIASPSKMSLQKKTLNRQKNARMTVRLRPRQVLCSNCQSICNEKSENVSSGRVNKEAESTIQKPLSSCLKDQRPLRETRQTNIVQSQSRARLKESPTKQVLVPKLIKLKPSDIENPTNLLSGPTNKQQNLLPKDEHHETPPSLEESSQTLAPNKQPILTRRKKRGTKRAIVTPSSEGTFKEGHIWTRSRASIEENLDDNLSKQPSTRKSLSLEKKEKEDESLKSIQDMSIASPDISGPENTYNSTTTSLPPDPSSDSSDSKSKIEKLNLRKKRSAGAMEDLWEESIFDCVKKTKPESTDVENSDHSDKVDSSDDSDKPRTTPILKISFGKGSVLKIPAKSTLSASEEENNEIQDPSEKVKNVSIKAAKKALKKAKKKAQKKALSTPTSSLSIFGGKLKRFGCKSPMSLGGMSPGRLGGFSPARFGGGSPGRFSGPSPGRFGASSPGRFGGASPGRFGGASPGKFGSMSPGRFGGASPRFSGSSTFMGVSSPRGNKETLLRMQPRKHKHKVKHKKKHKDDRKKSQFDKNEDNHTLKESIDKEENEHSPSTNKIDSNSNHFVNNSKWNSTDSPESPDNSLLPLNPIDDPQSPKLSTMRHKLSISIKRVSNANYIACDPSITLTGSEKELQESPDDSDNPVLDSSIPDLVDPPPFPENNLYINNSFVEARLEKDFRTQNHSNELEEVPEFPRISNEFLLDLNSYSTFSWEDVYELESIDGTSIAVGDIVWGKIGDFPWWPAKIVSLQSVKELSPGMDCSKRANISWYGSATYSCVPFKDIRPFSETFLLNEIEQKGTAYTEAIHQANYEAFHHNQGLAQNQTVQESPISASPREVDVAS